MDLYSLRVLSLCTGVGGLELGLKLAMPKSRTVAYVEIEAYACEILARRCEEKILDDAPIWSDIKSFDGKPWRGKVDCITGGYPCQPFSVAGKKLGDKDPRHLWPYIRRIISDVEPALCFFENVGGHLQLGFEQVHDDLQGLGYQVKTGLFTAEEVGAPHKRERLFILAYRNNQRWGRSRKHCNLAETQRENECQGNEYTKTLKNRNSGIMADNDSSRCDCGRNNNSERQIYSDSERNIETISEDRTQLQPRSGENGKTMADSCGVCCERLINERTCRGQSEETIGCRGDALARSKPGYSKGKLENSECIGHRGRCDGDQRGNDCEVETKRSLGSCRQIPVWPPRPNEFERWQHIPENLKPAIHRMADGVANRVDEVRACGNGVVPLVAAHAFRTLTANLEIIEENDE